MAEHETFLDRYTAYLQKDESPTSKEAAHEPKPLATAPVLPAAVSAPSLTPAGAVKTPAVAQEISATPEVAEELPAETLEAVLLELDELVGLEDIKAHVRTLVNLLKIQAERKAHDLPVVEIGPHRVFVGNPGTGKTTLARLMGRIYKAAGRLSKGHLIEVDRQGLVGGYVGQTAIKTREKLDEALGGVLFLDEAYALVPEGSGNDFGQEAITTILKFMEDNRGDFAFIVAGYPREMERFLASNSGFASRFNEIVDFPDYAVADLLLIFKGIVAKNHYRLSREAQTQVAKDFTWFVEHKQGNFANGRLVRRYFEELVQQQANRLGRSTRTLTKLQLQKLTPKDLPDDLVTLL